MTPGKSFNLRPGVVSFTGGKFPNPIFRVSELVFDEDLSPEGLSQTFQLLEKPIGDLDQVKVHALEWTLDEVANQQDAWMFGGQINPTAHFGTVQMEAGLGQYWWLNSDQIAQAQSKNTTAFTASGAPVTLPTTLPTASAFGFLGLISGTAVAGAAAGALCAGSAAATTGLASAGLGGVSGLGSGGLGLGSSL